MIVMPVPRTDFAQPRPVARGRITHRDLGAGKDENARNARVRRRLAVTDRFIPAALEQRRAYTAK